MGTPLTLLSLEQLVQIFPYVPSEHLAPHLDLLNASAAEAQVNTPGRWAMYLAMLGVESGCFQVWEENLNYGAPALLREWPHHFDEALAAQYAHQPERIANRAYANRMGNGDEQSGDGWKFRGRGAGDMTGFSEYLACGKYLGLDLVAHPELAAGDARFRTAAWGWMVKGMNQLSDLRQVENATKRWNGGLTGLPDRQAIYTRACTVLGVS